MVNGEEPRQRAETAQHQEQGESQDDSLPRTGDTVAEFARQQGVEPIRSSDELIQPGVFDSDEELEEFLAQLRAASDEGPVNESWPSLQSSRRG